MVAINHINFALGSSSSPSCLAQSGLALFWQSCPYFGIFALLWQPCPLCHKIFWAKAKHGGLNTFFASVCLFKTPARARWWHIITNSMWLRLPVPLYLQKAIWAPIFFSIALLWRSKEMEGIMWGQEKMRRMQLRQQGVQGYQLSACTFSKRWKLCGHRN